MKIYDVRCRITGQAVRLVKNLGIRRFFLLGVATAGVVGSASPGYSQTPANIEWVSVFGTPEEEFYDSHSALDTMGNVYTTGVTRGDLVGTNAGREDVFITKHDSLGNRLWTRQYGTSEIDIYSGVVVDSLGFIYAAGYSLGDFAGNSAQIGSSDAILSKFDASGSMLWTKHYGSTAFDNVVDVAIDASDKIHFTGWTSGDLAGPDTHSGQYDEYVIKVDTDGEVIWSQQRGTVGTEEVLSIDVDAAGNVFTAGGVAGHPDQINPGSYGPMIAKYDSDGNVLWEKVIDDWRSGDVTLIVADDEGGAYIPVGESMVRVEPDGSRGWTSEDLDPSIGRIPRDITFNAAGNILALATRQSSDPNELPLEYSLVELDGDGNFLEEFPLSLGLDARNYISGMTDNGHGTFYFTGYTSLNGDADVFVAKLTIPEPASICLVGLGGLLFARRRRRV